MSKEVKGHEKRITRSYKIWVFQGEWDERRVERTGKINIGKHEEKYRLRDLRVDGMIILKYILEN
jgi:hypothetical protein